METGARVWIHGEEDTWQAGVVEECREDEEYVQVRAEGSELVKVAASNVYLRNDYDDFTDVPNLISLQYLHEPELLHAVCNRYENDLIYTYVGEILLSFNPFQRLNIYTNKEIQLYATTPDQDGNLPPHVFAIAANAYKSLCDEKLNQSILVSGESGAGKTENTKFLMQYLTEVGALDAETAAAMASAATKSKRSSKNKVTASTTQIQTQILQTNPILEAFGNARTVRNDNSSRFGKFIELQFGSHHKIVGAKLSVYLLEKIRVSHQSADERNFHIFYELCAGADDELAAQFELSDAEDFDILSESGCFTRRDGTDDSEQFDLTRQAFTDMGIPEDEQISIFGIVAALLHLGNVAFCAKTCQASNLEQAAVEEETMKHLDIAARLLGVSSEELTRALMTRQVATTKDKITVNLTPFQASEAKQSLTQSLYGGLFKWIVNRLSMIIRHDSASVNTVGILDIFGFENLHTNGFEQLCINYANERLQAQFNELVFAKEQRMYEAEGIEWKYIEYPDNAPCLQLLEDRPHGMWCLLDEEGMLPKGSNEGWISKLYSVYLEDEIADMKRRQSEPTPKAKLAKSASTIKPIRPFYATSSQRVEFQFVIGHFAGRVMYENDAFLQKNQDALPAEAIDLCGSSSNGIVQSLLQPTPGSSGKAALNKRSSSKQLTRQPSNLRSSSVSAQFKTQLDDLIQVIGRTQARYIRCIKSNEKGAPRHLNKPRVVQQLRSGGVLEAVRIARAGYAVRVDHFRFMEAFGFFFRPKKGSVKKDTKGLCEQTVAAVMIHFFADNAQTVEIAQQVVRGAKFDRHAFQEACGLAGFQIGNSKIFFRKDVYNDMRRFRLQTLSRNATVIQRHVRGFVARRITKRMKHAVIVLQKWMHERLARMALLRRSSTKVQTRVRCWLARQKYLKSISANLRLQRWIRDRLWKRKLYKRFAARVPPKPVEMVKEKTIEKREVQPVKVVATAVPIIEPIAEPIAEPVAEPVVPVTPPPTPPTYIPPVEVAKSSPGKASSPVDQPIRRPEVDSLMVSLSVENAQLKQQIEELRNTPPPATVDGTLEFAHQQIRMLSTQLVQLQMQCALLELESNDKSSPAVDLSLPAPTSLEEAQNQLQTLLQKVRTTKQHLEDLEVRKLMEEKTKQEETKILAMMETIQPVVTTVRHVVSYVPVVSYVVSQVESKAHISPRTWYLLLQTSHSVVKSVTDMATSVLTSRPRAPSSDASAEVVSKLKEKLEVLMEINIEQAIQIKQLKEKLQESLQLQQSMQMKSLEDKLSFQMNQIRAHDDEKMKRMEEELAYTTSCFYILDNAIVRGPLKEKQVVVHDSFDFQDPIMYNSRR